VRYAVVRDGDRGLFDDLLDSLGTTPSLPADRGGFQERAAISQAVQAPRVAKTLYVGTGHDRRIRVPPSRGELDPRWGIVEGLIDRGHETV
jgi:hypothetical protein